MSDEDTRTALDVLVQTIRAKNENYSGDLDHAKLDAAEAVMGAGWIKRPPELGSLSADRGGAEVRYTDAEKLYAETIADMRRIARNGTNARTRVRAAALLLKWGEL